MRAPTCANRHAPRVHPCLFPNNAPSLPPHRLWNVAPVEANGWAFLGEVGTKWVGASSARVTGIIATAYDLRVTVRGAIGERVELKFAPPAPATRAVVVLCEVPQTGTATATVPAGTCA